LPEIWIPYGSVESLVTVQAENLGSVVEPQAEKGSGEPERLLELLKGASALFVCDAAPPTLEVLREMSSGPDGIGTVKVVSAAPKKIEAAVPAIKGRVSTLPPPMPTSDAAGVSVSDELTRAGRKLFLGTGRPDPLLGIVDSKVEACLNWVSGAYRIALQARKGMEPTPFEKTESYEEIEEIASKMKDSSFLTVAARGGKPRAVMEDAPFDAVKNGFLQASAPPARALVVGAGGSGFDDTLSSAIRGIWSVLPAVRRSGSVLLLAECGEGLGSTALELASTGRLAGGDRKKVGFVDGLDEVFYLSKLKEEYDVLLLTGLPEVYAKSKLGLTTARGSGEAVGRLLNRLGRSGKMNVVTRSPECRVTSA
jgi:hypothetical protein